MAIECHPAAPTMSCHAGSPVIVSGEPYADAWIDQALEERIDPALVGPRWQ